MTMFLDSAVVSSNSVSVLFGLFHVPFDEHH